MTFDKAFGIIAAAFGVYLAVGSFGILPLPKGPFPIFSCGWAFFGWGTCLIRIEKLKQQLQQ